MLDYLLSGVLAIALSIFVSSPSVCVFRFGALGGGG